MKGCPVMPKGMRAPKCTLSSGEKLHRTLLSTYFKQNSILLARPVEPDGVHSILICDYHCLCGLCRRGCPNGGVHLRGFPFKRCHQLSYKLRVLLCSILLWETKGRQEVGTSRGVRRNLPFVATTTKDQVSGRHIHLMHMTMTLRNK